MAKHDYSLTAQSSPTRKRRTLGFLAGNLHMGMAPRLWPGMIAKLQNRFEIRTQDVGGTSVMYVKVKE